MAVVTQIFPNFASALAACGTGYNDADIADVIAFKTALPLDARQFVPEQALNSIIAVGIAAAEITHRPLNVLDFGGGCGFHYFRVASAMRTQVRWAIVETPTMVDRAAKLGRGHFDVFTDIAAAAEWLDQVDIIHASSSIQYTPDPLATLKTLAALRSRYFALARFPLWVGADTVGLQISPLSANGIGPMPPGIPDRQVQYPVTFTNFDAVIRTLTGYQIVLALSSPSSIYTVRGQNVQGISAMFRFTENVPDP